MTATGWVALSVAAAALAGCTEMAADMSDDTGLSGTQSQFDAMTGPCLAQAARMTGLGAGAITVQDRLQTGGGPILTLDAGGTSYTCRLEADGSVTVFSEFAN